MWEYQPIKAVDLAKLCQEKLAWKRTTTYTIIKRLGERGVLKLENGIVTALISKEEAEAAEIETFVESKFGGSLPAFVAAFTKHQDLSDSDLDEVQKMIDRIRKGGGSQ
jgi:predicted transcriptional regulator